MMTISKILGPFMSASNSAPSSRSFLRERKKDPVDTTERYARPRRRPASRTARRCQRSVTASREFPVDD